MSSSEDTKPTRLFVGGLGDDLSKDDVEHEFSKYGKLNSIWVAQNPPGFAFVEFDDDRDADEAIKNMNGAEIKGSLIRVEMARGRGGRGGRGRGGRGGGGGGWRDDRGGRGGMRGRSRDGDSGYGGRGGFGRRQGGYDSYRNSGQQGSGGWDRREGSNDYDGADGDDGSGYRSRSIGQRRPY